MRKLGPLVVVTALLLAGCSNSTTPDANAEVPKDVIAASLKPTLKVDFRKVALVHLDEQTKARLVTDPVVQVTFSDGRGFIYTNANGHMTVEGDIMVSPSEKAYDYLLKAEGGDTRIGVLGGGLVGLSAQGMGQTNNKWPNGVIPYSWAAGTFNSNEEALLKKSIETWNSQAGQAVRWEWNPNARNRVYFTRMGGGACGSSYVGTIGGAQPLSLNLTGSCANTHVVIHEMGHAAGLWHEHQRCDRDKYVKIPSNYLYDSVNFGLNCNVNMYGKYDYDSIMNYGYPYVYAQPNSNNYRGDPKNIGDFYKLPKLSQGDIETLHLMYTGKVPGGTTNPNPEPKPDPKPTNGSTKEYTGYLYQGYYVYVPQNSYLTYQGGKISVQLEASNGADFDIYLMQYINGYWYQVANSTSPGSSESINYQAAAGYYTVMVKSEVGNGNYSLKINLGGDVTPTPKSTPDIVMNIDDSLNAYLADDGGKWTLGRISYDTYAATFGKTYNIQKAPTLVALYRGKEVNRLNARFDDNNLRKWLTTVFSTNYSHLQ